MSGKAALFGFLAGLGGAVASYVVVNWLRNSTKKDRSVTDKRDRFRVDGRDGVEFEEYIPPLPQDVKEMLSNVQLCHLSCVDEGGPPHTSLMNFTFVQDDSDSIIIMTTRRDTKKYILIEKHPEVSLLLHDFPQMKTSERSFKRTLSISIMGVARIETAQMAEKYRRIHLEKNMQYSQFIEGEDKAVITIKIMQARMCNIQDRVTNWKRGDP